MATTETVAFEPYDPAFQADPYPVYDRIRPATPFFHGDWGLTFFARLADVDALLRDRRLGRDVRHVMEPSEDLRRRLYPPQYPTWTKTIRGSFIDLEPPEHTRLRALVAKAFTRRHIDRLRPRVEGLAERVLDRALAEGGMEVIADFATPIPLMTIADLLAIPEPDRQQLLVWSHAIVRLFEPGATADEGRAAERAVTEFAEYVRRLVLARRAEPGEDLISAMATVEIDGRHLSDDEVVSSAILTLNAGHEATVHAIGNGVLALLRHPDQFDLLREEPDTVATAVDELLRFDAPLQMFERWVLADMEWNGHRLTKGGKVGLLFGAANRDPDAFADPGRLDLRRSENPHVSFGAGIHFCAGAPLAWMELEVAFAALARRVRQLEAVVEEPPRITSLVFRGLTELPVTVTA
jgi:cytochrome P450